MSPAPEAPGRRSAAGVFWIFLRLGLTSFGGPVAHLGYFRNEFVRRRRWLSDTAYADVVALCQFLPGPASSQVGMAIGLQRAGVLGLVAAWAAFTVPSAALLVGFAFGIEALDGLGGGWLDGLKAAAAAVVAHAVIGMARTLTPDLRRALLALAAAAVVLVVPHPLVQVGVIAAGGLLGWVLLPRAVGAGSEEVQDAGGGAGGDPAGVDTHTDRGPVDAHTNRGPVDAHTNRGPVDAHTNRGPVDARPGRQRSDGHEHSSAGSAAGVTGRHRLLGVGCLVVFAALLVVLPVLARWVGGAVALVDVFYRTGALVFGGGHVVLPLLETQMVGTGMVDTETFLAGYGAAQAVPGPLFTFAAYLGAVQTGSPSGLLGAALALVAIFLPSALLVLAVLPFWDSLRRRSGVRRVLAGVNAGVVGLLAAALVDPVITQGLTSWIAVGIAAVGLVLLVRWAVPSWALVLGAALAGWVLL